MYTRYYVTGGTGFLGSHIIKELTEQGAKVSALVLPNDKYVKLLPDSVSVTYGDVTDINSIRLWLKCAERPCCVIHCAGIVSIATSPGPMLEKVNVGGTANILNVCKELAIDRLVYVSSVHAIPELEKGKTMTEITDFSPDKVSGAYAKSKATATAMVLSAAKEGLNAVVVHPSGIIGPNDYSLGNIANMLLAYCRGKLPLSVKGGYDFVDVRDAAHGVIACSEKGRTGECYILSGEYATVDEIISEASMITNVKKPLFNLPLKPVMLIARLVERMVKKGKTPFFTPYSIAVLGSNASFSHEKASNELGYHPRPINETVLDTVNWIKRTYLQKPKKTRRPARSGLSRRNMQMTQ